MERPKPVLIFYKPLRSLKTEIFWQGKHFRMKEDDVSSGHLGDLVSRYSYNVNIGCTEIAHAANEFK
jgi:hypothetical protein